MWPKKLKKSCSWSLKDICLPKRELKLFQFFSNHSTLKGWFTLKKILQSKKFIFYADLKHSRMTHYFQIHLFTSSGLFCIMQYITENIAMSFFPILCSPNTYIFSKGWRCFCFFEVTMNSKLTILVFYGILWILLGLRNVCLKYDTKGLIGFKK